MKTTLKGGAMLAPVPAVLVSCSHEGKNNIITVAWAGTVCTRPPMVSISVRPERHSYEMLEKSGVFCINLPTVELAKAVDWCGVRSGKDYDKFAETGLTPSECESVSCVGIEECPVTLECRVVSKTPLGSHDMFLAEVVAVDVDGSLIEPSGRIALEKAGLLAYAHGDYFSLGKKIGDFGFSVRKKRRSTKRSKK